MIWSLGTIHDGQSLPMDYWRKKLLSSATYYMLFEGQLLTVYWVVLETKVLTWLESDFPYPAANNALGYESNTLKAQKVHQAPLAKTETIPTGYSQTWTPVVSHLQEQLSPYHQSLARCHSSGGTVSLTPWLPGELFGNNCMKSEDVSMIFCAWQNHHTWWVFTGELLL